MVLRINVFLLGILLLISAFSVTSSPQINNKFINPYQVYNTSENLNSSTIKKLAKYDLVILDRTKYRDSSNNNSWEALKKINPEIIISLYQNGPQVADNTDHPEWFLKNESGDFIRDINNNDYLILDYGNSEVADYWIKSTNDDIIDRPWKADGIMVDNLASLTSSTIKNDPSRRPTKYPDTQTNATVTNTFISDITETLHEQGQIVVASRTNSTDGEFAWLDLDSRANTPDIILDKAAFAINSGAGDVYFYPSNDWLRQITTPLKITNSSVALSSHSDLSPGQTGIDADGNEVNFEQIFWYSLGSYLLAKNDEIPTLFSFDYARKVDGNYKKISWFEIYTTLDLGQALQDAIPAIKSNSVSVYMREFEKGYVYVNPLATAANNIPAPSSKTLKVDFGLDGSRLSESALTDNILSVEGHSTVVLLKTSHPSSINSISSDAKSPNTTSNFNTQNNVISSISSNASSPSPCNSKSPSPTVTNTPVISNIDDIPVPTQNAKPSPVIVTKPVVNSNNTPAPNKNDKPSPDKEDKPVEKNTVNTSTPNKQIILD